MQKYAEGVEKYLKSGESSLLDIGEILKLLYGLEEDNEDLYSFFDFPWFTEEEERILGEKKLGKIQEKMNEAVIDSAAEIKKQVVDQFPKEKIWTIMEEEK